MTNRVFRVGTVDYPASKQVVQRDVDVVELSATHGVPIKASTAKKWRSEAGAILAFSLQAPKHLVEKPKEGTPLPGDREGYGGFKLTKENLKIWNNFTKAAAALGADAVVILTPASFTPAKANLDAFGDFFKGVRENKGLESIDIVWDPSGPWEIEQAGEVAQENRILLAVDPLRDPPPMGPSAYFRLGPFAAMGSRIGLYDLERIRDASTPFEKVTCVFNTSRALDDARNLKKILD